MLILKSVLVNCNYAILKNCPKLPWKKNGITEGQVNRPYLYMYNIMPALQT